MDDLPTLTEAPCPSAARPLLGMTILVVEDSLYACDAMRLMCLHSGARIRRADCLRSARRHLSVYRPSAVIIDLGLPDGSGLDLIEELNDAQPRVGAIIGTSGMAGAEAGAINAGADGFLPKPLANLGTFQQTILNTLPSEKRPGGPRLLRNERVRPDPLAFRDDMVHASTLLDLHDEGPVIDYVAQFLGGVAQAANDTPLLDAAMALRDRRACGSAPTGTPLAQLAGLVQDRLGDHAVV